MSANVSGQTVVVRVASVGGRVLISGNARASSTLRQGELLAPGDTTDTRGGGRVRLELSDGSLVIVQPETRLILQDCRSASSLRELLRVFVGRVRIKVNRFGAQPNPYRVNSPTASIAVRGTEFDVAVGAQGDTEVVVYEGLVEVSSLSDPQRRVLVEPDVASSCDLMNRFAFLCQAWAAKSVSAGNAMSAPEQASNQTGSSGTAQGSANDSLRSAAGVYELQIDSIVDSGETALPSRFAAFPDSHLDSLENPSYATEFTTTEGRIFSASVFRRHKQ
ncbi:MAG: FecR family protein [Pyrinomonadaceae bacterium]